MNNQLPYYVTYRFYDSKKRRLTIFAKPIFEMGEELLEKPTHLQLFVITCSKKDQFDKRYAWRLLEQFLAYRKEGREDALAHPMELLLPIENGKPKYTFLRWCESVFYKYKQLEFALVTPCLVKGDEMLEMDLRRSSELMQLVDDEGIVQSESEN